VKAVLFLFLFCGSVFAAELTPRQERDIYVLAYGQYTGPREWLDKPPIVHHVSEARICELAHQPPHCTVLGYYQPGNVYLVDTLDFSTTWAAGVLLHEDIHHLQWLQHGQVAIDAADAAADAAVKVAKEAVRAACELWLPRERQAYTIHAYVLENAGDDLGARHVRYLHGQLTCGPQ
jgi:hypothetical protein